MPKVESTGGDKVCKICGRILFASEDGQCHLCSLGINLPVPKKVISEKTKAKFVTEVEVIDPDTKKPIKVSIYKEERGGMIGIDSSYIEQDVGEVISPFGNGELELE
jgi:hypothetical protein